MKRAYLLLALLLCSLLSPAQGFTPPPFADIDTNYRSYVNNVFGALEAARVPTGLLVDYRFDFTDPKIYNGSVLVDSKLCHTPTPPITGGFFPYQSVTFSLPEVLTAKKHEHHDHKNVF